MLKKLVCTMLVFSIISVFGITAFAAPTDSPSVTPAATPQVAAEKADALLADVADVLEEVSADANGTKKLLVTITRPEGTTDSTYKSSYVISGVSDYSDITVVLQVYDEESKSYVPMENTDGESSWGIGSFGVFSKEIELKEGPNAIRILAFSASQKGSLSVGDIQVNKFTVTLLNPQIKDLFKGVVDFTIQFLEKINFK